MLCQKSSRRYYLLIDIVMKKPFLVALFITIFLSGCVSRELEEQLAQNQQTITQLRNNVIDLKAENEGLQKQLKEAKQGRIPSGVIAVDAGDSRGNAYSNGQVQAGTVVSTEATGYDNALQLYRAGDINGAIAGFQQYLASGAQGEQAALAQYWIGTGYYSQRNYEQALRYLGTFLKNLPQSDKTDTALNQLITSLRAVGRDNDAQILEQHGVSAIH